MAALSRLPEAEALRCVNELNTTDLSTVRNISAYFSTICRRAAENTQGAPLPTKSYDYTPPALPAYRPEYYAPPQPAPAVHPPPSGHPASLGLAGPGPWVVSASDLQLICQLCGGSYAQLQAALAAGQRPPVHYEYEYPSPIPPAVPAPTGYVPTSYTPPPSYLVHSAPPSAGIEGIEARVVSKRVQELISQGVIDHSTLDPKAVVVLNGLRPDNALEALEELEGAMKEKSVRNPSAFFMGICKGRAQGQREDGTEDIKRRKTDDGPSRSSYQTLPATVREKIASYADQGVFPGKYGLEGELDSKAVERILTLSEQEQITLIDEVANSDLRNVRNLCAFLMSKVKKA
ncbi:hypothetical protein CYMTET_55827 [Cymbomonas tetramitiformis]|uniref:Heterogeneous nuclear ribonucleoprotein Q acidic domain-containing protein n=1 Tax=Cymbomonas tetramitiformis TaxID=36881 RepID=A0AAE0BCI0_9CHLO|nr:hypothetical protein CYMTET_55827 [Cymbomonas tetramitiformis]